MSERPSGTGHDAPDHQDPVATEDPVAGADAASDEESAPWETPDEETGQAADPGDSDSPVGAAMRSLDGLADRPVEEHPEVYEEVHKVLRRSLDDEGSASP